MSQWDNLTCALAVDHLKHLSHLVKHLASGQIKAHSHIWLSMPDESESMKLTLAINNNLKTMENAFAATMN